MPAAKSTTQTTHGQQARLNTTRTLGRAGSDVNEARGKRGPPGGGPSFVSLTAVDQLRVIVTGTLIAVGAVDGPSSSSPLYVCPDVIGFA